MGGRQRVTEKDLSWAHPSSLGRTFRWGGWKVYEGLLHLKKKQSMKGKNDVG